MKYPKLVIATDGDCTVALLDGVFIGPGIERLDFSTQEDGKICPGGVIRVMDLSVSTARLETGEVAEKRFTDFMEFLAKKEDRPCCNKGGSAVTE